MTDFTDTELKYIEIFNHLKDEIPLRDASVFQQPITNRSELFDTILFQPKDQSTPKKKIDPPIFSPASIMFYNTGILSSTARQAFFFHEGSHPFSKEKSQKEFSSTLCNLITSYTNAIKLPKQTENPIDPTHLAGFLRDYRVTIDLLLKGPPHADEHTIDKDLAEQWILAQKTEERRRLARRLIEKTIYISHTELLKTIKKCVEQTKKKLIDAPVTFIVGTRDKSNYYVSLLFYHYWKEAGLPLDNVKIYMDSIIVGNLIDIDEMAYSGTQTTGTLANVYGMLLTTMKKALDLENSHLEGYALSKNFLPLPLVEYILYKNKVNYCVVRFFCSEIGKEELLKMPPTPRSSFRHRVKPPFYLIIGREIPSIHTLFGKEDADKLSFLFGPRPGSPATTVYFNHKIANTPSTFLYPLAYGVVPELLLWSDQSDPPQNGNTEILSPEEKRYYTNLQIKNAANRTGIEFIPFIRFCGKDDRLMPTSRGNLIPSDTGSFTVSKQELSQEYRCPYAWYKDIDYTTGTYKRAPNVPLPYGPTEENLKGGRRKTKKQKRTAKRKTRSSHK